MACTRAVQPQCTASCTDRARLRREDENMTPKVTTYTVAEVAERWRVCGKTVWRLLRRGKLRAVKIGRSTRIRESEVERYERVNERC